MTTTVRNIMVSFTLVGSMLLAAYPASAQGRRGMSTGSTTMSTSRSSETRSSADRSSSSVSMQRSASRRAVDRPAATSSQVRTESRRAAERRAVTTQSRVERPAATTQSRVERPAATSRATENRTSSSSMNNGRPRPNTGNGTGYRESGVSSQSASSNYVVGGNHNGNNGGVNHNDNNGNRGNGGNYGDNHNRPGNNGNHKGNNGHHNGNYDNRHGNNGNHNGNHGYDHRPDRNRGHNAYRDHYSWNHAHNDWSRPLPPPARAYRPAPYHYHRPVIPAHWRPCYGAPVIDRILGITFGTMFNASLSYLYTNGYNIDGYDKGVVYLRNVHMMSLTWPDVMLCYDNYGRLINAQFIHSSYYNDRSRYNRLYHDLCAAYGTPIEIDGGGITWFGGNRVGYVTLSMSCTGNRFYTNLYIGS